MSRLPAALVTALNSTGAWTGASHKGDFTRIHKTWPDVMGPANRELVDVSKHCFHGLGADDNKSITLAATAKGVLLGKSGAPLGWTIWKPRGMAVICWSLCFNKLWEDYCANDVVVPLTMHCLDQHKQAEYYDAMLALYSGSLEQAQRASVASAFNGFKKDFNHVFRSIAKTINPEWPLKSSFLWFLSKAVFLQSTTAVQAEENRLNSRGFSHDQVKNWHHTATKQRVTQTTPRPEELRQRIEELIELWDELLVDFVVGSTSMDCFTNEDKFRSLWKKFVEEVRRDRFSDPPNVPMYVLREDGTLNSLRGTNILEGFNMHQDRMLANVTRMGVQEHCHRMARFIFKRNLQSGAKNMGWATVKHFDVTVMLLAHEADPAQYPMVYHLQNHVDTGLSFGADNFVDGIADGVVSDGADDDATAAVPLDGQAESMSASVQPVPLLSGSDTGKAAGGIDYDESGEAGEGGDSADEGVGEPSATEAAAKMERKVLQLMKKKQPRKSDLMSMKYAVRATMSTPINTTPEVSLALYTLSIPGCAVSAQRAAAVYNGLVEGFSRAGKPCVFRRKDPPALQKFMGSLTKQLAGVQTQGTVCEVVRGVARRSVCRTRAPFSLPVTKFAGVVSPLPPPMHADLCCSM